MKKNFILLSILMLFSFSCRNDSSKQAVKADPFLHIKTAPVVRADMVDTVRIYGTVQLRQEAFIASQFDGRLTDFSLLLGDVVQKDMRIGTIVPPAREALMQVMNQIDAKMRPLLEREIKTIPLTSPLTGVVLEVMHHSGDVVQKGEAIIHIGDLSKLDVHGDMPVRYVPLIRHMKTIRTSFINFSHAPLRLPIEAISGKVDIKKQTVPIRLRLDNSKGEFRPGMLVQLIFPGQEHNNALTIPRSALLEEEGVFSVFVLKGTHVEKRLIRVGIFQDDKVEIITGVEEGEQVATQKAYSLTDGLEVIVE